jgi:hypothetical protein
MPVVKHKPIASIFPLSKYLERHGWEHNLWLKPLPRPRSFGHVTLAFMVTSSDLSQTEMCTHLPRVVGKTLAMFSTYFKILPIDPSTGLSTKPAIPYVCPWSISLCVYTLLYASKYNIFILCFSAGSFLYPYRFYKHWILKGCNKYDHVYWLMQRLELPSHFKKIKSKYNNIESLGQGDAGLIAGQASPGTNESIRLI